MFPRRGANIYLLGPSTESDPANSSSALVRLMTSAGVVKLRLSMVPRPDTGTAATSQFG